MPIAEAPAPLIALAPQPVFIPGFGADQKPNGPAFVEFVGGAGAGQSPRGSFAVDAASNTRVYDVAWEQLQGAVAWFLGSQSVKSVGGTKYIARDVPHHDADWGVFVPDGALDTARRGEPYLYAVQLEYEGDGVNADNPPGVARMQSPQGTARYRLARCRVRYDWLSYEVLTDAQMVERGHTAGGVPDEATLRRYVTILPKPKAQYLGLPAGSMKYVSDQAEVTPGPGKIQATADLQITHHLVPEHAVASILVNPTLQASGAQGALDTTPGKVNSATILGVTAGKLLCLPPELNPRRGPRGERLWDVVHYWEFFDKKHNYVPRLVAGVLSYVEVTADGVTLADSSTTAGKHIYDAADFAPMFRPPP